MNGGGSPLLEYESQIFLEAYHEDGLLVLARGLGIERLFLNFLKLYLDPENTVIVLNANQKESEYFIQTLKEEGEVFLPKIINTELSNSRVNSYLEGGVVFVTTRIFIVDILTDKIPKSLLNGLLIYNAHTVADRCQENFAIKLFVENNEAGFIKAFSDSAHSFNKGLISLSVVLSNLNVPTIHIWPRFHSLIINFYNEHKPNIVEVQIHPTKLMKDIQMNLFELIQLCIKELKKYTNMSYVLEDIKLENVLSRTFLDILRIKLEPFWDQLTHSAQNYILSIKTLRKLLMDLYQINSAEMLEHLQAIQIECKNGFRSVLSLSFKHNINWILEPAGALLFANVKKRKELGQIKPNEENPKLETLRDVLKNITKESKSTEASTSEDYLTILIITRNQYIADKVKSALNEDSSSAEPITSKKIKTELKASVEDKDFIEVPDANKNIVIVTINSRDIYALSILQTLQPTHIILYEPDLDIVRNIEVYQALIWATGPILNVYFLMYVDSVEEQLYLSSLRNEKEGFEYLIRQKGALIKPDKTDKELETPITDTDLISTTTTRKAGGQALLDTSDSPHSLIYVDVREFKSDLPAYLYSQNLNDPGDPDDTPARKIKIVPTTLLVGDYILTNQICIERKSINDLVQSLNNGRLYQQAKMMVRTFAKPFLLIEFDTKNRPFLLQSRSGTARSLGSSSSSRNPAQKNQMGQEISAEDIQSKLVLLTLTFPKLRILWSCTPKMAAEMFAVLKAGKPEPSLPLVASIDTSVVDSGTQASSKETGGDTIKMKFDPSHLAHDMLMKCPGLSTKNIDALTRKCSNFSRLIDLSKSEVATIMQNTIAAKRLYNFLHNIE